MFHKVNIWRAIQIVGFVANLGLGLFLQRSLRIACEFQDIGAARAVGHVLAVLIYWMSIKALISMVLGLEGMAARVVVLVLFLVDAILAIACLVDVFRVAALLGAPADIAHVAY